MIRDFKIYIPDDQLDLLYQKIDLTRWPDEMNTDKWSMGTDKAFLQNAMHVWRNDFSWRDHEAKLNEAGSYKFLTSSGLELHYLHQKTNLENAIPILLTHGWPGSVQEFLSLMPLLTKGRDGLAFNVVCPAIPGYGFSDKPTKPGMNSKEIAKLEHELMMALGYDKYMVQGGDWGSTISKWIAELFPEHCLGLHLNLVIAGPPEGQDPMAGVTKEEAAGLQNFTKYQEKGSGYFAIQSTKPQTVGYGLNDSPVGLAGWIMEKFHAWTDEDSNNTVISLDQMLAIVSLYWFTESITSSARLYYENGQSGFTLNPVKPPMAGAIFKNEITKPPRIWADHTLSLIHI